MLRTVTLNIKRKWLMRQFKCFDIKYHSAHLGKAMANEQDEFNRKYNHDKLREGIQKICEKKKIKHDDLRLIEDELNDYINGLVNKAHDEESQKLKVREFVDTRIKVKRADSLGSNDSLPADES